MAEDGKKTKKPRKAKARNASQAEVQYRCNRLFQLIRNGGTRQDCLRFSEATWGCGESTTDSYLRKVREMLKSDFDIERAEFTAQLMQQITSIGMEARRTGQLNIALGACNSLAKLAQLEGQ